MRHLGARLWSRLPLVLLGAAFVLSAATNIVLFRATRNVAVDYREYRSEMESRPIAGVQLPPLVGKDRNGQPLKVDYEGIKQQTLLLAFSPVCPYCNENWPSWSRVIAASRPELVRVIAIDTTGQATHEFLTAHFVGTVTLFKSTDYATNAAYNIQLVPTTMLIRPDGTLRQSWVGVLDADEVRALEMAVQSPLESHSQEPLSQ